MPNNISKSFFIYLSIFLYNSFLVNKTINSLDKNMFILFLVILDFVK